MSYATNHHQQIYVIQIIRAISSYPEIFLEKYNLVNWAIIDLDKGLAFTSTNISITKPLANLILKGLLEEKKDKKD